MDPTTERNLDIRLPTITRFVLVTARLTLLERALTLERKPLLGMVMCSMPLSLALGQAQVQMVLKLESTTALFVEIHKISSG